MTAGMAVLTLAHAINALAPQERPSDRERAVLAVLEQLNVSDEVWSEATVFEREQNELGRPSLVPAGFVTCSLSASLLDAARAKQLARELFAVYGFDAQPDCLLREEGVEVLLDGYDAGRKVGFKLRGMMPGNDEYPWWRPVPEPPSTDLTRAELERLEAAGVRLDVADLGSYQATLDDECTSILAYLSGVVAFLDEVTSGPDIDLRAVLGVTLQRFRITAVEGATDWREKMGTWRSFHMAARGPVTLCFEWDGIQCLERREDGELSGWYLPDQPSPTRGAPSRLHVNLFGRHRTEMSIRVTQAQPDGTLECWSPGTTVLLPSSFDVTRRFTVVLQLDPGEYLCDPWVMIGCREP